MQQGMLPDRQRSSFIALLVKRLCRCFSQTCGGQSVYTGLHGCACAACMGWVRMRSLHGCARAAVDKDTGPSPAGGSGARPLILNLCPSFHVWLPGCCIHPILYLKYVPPPLVLFGPTCCEILTTGEGVVVTSQEGVVVTSNVKEYFNRCNSKHAYPLAKGPNSWPPNA